MKTLHLLPSLALGCAAFAAGAAASEPPPAPPATVAVAPAATLPADSGLRFNFRGAPLEQVLNYLSDAAGFVIVLDTPVRGTVDMWSTQPVSKAEAVQLLNLALNKQGFTATLQGRTLIVASKEDAKKRGIPIRTGNDPEEIPPTAELVTQIIPLRNIDAAQAARDLATLLPGSAAITPNQDSNSLVVTDTQINVRHVVELVAALDSSVESVSTMRVFKLKNSDPTEMAQLLTSLFQAPTSGSTNRGGAPAFGPAAFFGGFGGQGGPGAALAAAAAARGNRGTTSSTRRQSVVVAVPDPRTASVIVTAAKDAMPQIAEIIAQLDANPARNQKVYVYTMENANVRQVEQVLKNLFQSSNARNTTATQNDPLTTRASSNTQTGGATLNLGNSSGGGLR